MVHGAAVAQVVGLLKYSDKGLPQYMAGSWSLSRESCNLP